MVLNFIKQKQIYYNPICKDAIDKINNAIGGFKNSISKVLTDSKLELGEKGFEYLNFTPGLSKPYFFPFK